MKEKELAAELNNWFKQIKIKQNFWNRNPVAQVIKENLSKIGNFKNLPRGNPRKAHETMRQKLFNKFNG